MLIFSHEISWMKSGTELNQFLRAFLFLLSSIDNYRQLSKAFVPNTFL